MILPKEKPTKVCPCCEDNSKELLFNKRQKRTKVLAKRAENEAKQKNKINA